MLERGKLYKIETKYNKIFEGIFLGSYYKVSSSNSGKNATRVYDFITKEGKLISNDYKNISKSIKLKGSLSDNIMELINQYEKLYWKKLEDAFLISKIEKESIEILNQLDDLSNKIRIANDYFNLNDLMNDDLGLLKSIDFKFKSVNNNINMNLKFNQYIYNDEIDNCSLNCFEIDKSSLDSDILKNVNYKIKDIKTAYKLYNLSIKDDLIDGLNKDLEYFKIHYNKDYSNLSITDNFVCISNLIQIEFITNEFNYENYKEMKDDIKYCCEVINDHLEEKLIDVKAILSEVIYGVEQEKEYEKQCFFDILDLFTTNLNINNNIVNKCYC